MARLFQMKAFNYPIIKLTIYFASGILVSDYIGLSVVNLLYSLSIGLLILIISNYYCKKQNAVLALSFGANTFCFDRNNCVQNTLS